MTRPSGRRLMMHAATIWLAALGVAGCSEQPTVPQFDERVCDGSQQIRLAVLTAGGGPPEPGSQVINENGFDFLYVRGDCQAWVKPYGWWEAVRRVALSEQSSKQLFDGLALGSWHALSGEYSGGAFDAAALVLVTNSSKIVCGGGCFGSLVPSAILQIGDSASAQIVALTDAGTAIDGGVRFAAVRNSPGAYPFLVHLEWPLDTPTLADVARPEPEQVEGSGVPVTDPAAAAALRALLRQALAGAGQNFLYHVPVRDDAGTTYRVFLRDMLPFESDAGLVTLPGGG
ncbi:MAG TPA: hypothetical protein VLT82_13020 [Myxococcaceae bacterium]|nr:hypothetical protein [Myxococcaceae bacterium]